MSNIAQDSAEVVSVNVSTEKGTVKLPVDEIVVNERGIVGDAHAGAWHRQVSLLGQDNIDRFEKVLGRKIAPGEFAENITLSGIDLNTVAVLDRFRIGTALLEVTQIGKECHGDGCAIFREVGKCVMPKEGIFCRVLEGGTIRPGDSVDYIPKVLSFRIITLSDRAYRGEYSDRSGPRVKEILQDFLSTRRWHPIIDEVVLPDDAQMLRAELLQAKDSGTDVIFTTGGTGIGPRDITPETVESICDKIIPGIMEHIRMKFGAEKPNALLSRGVAGVAGCTLIYTLPGSVRAVDEYMGEILRTLEHLLFMLHGIDRH
ncbi:MAG: MOSC domain-containing protein [Armatimonadetes bacterium]|nr:MOSC domain-containing protein [Armatimonadota bacterium]